MSERADDDVRGEQQQQQRRAARQQLKQQQQQQTQQQQLRGEGSTAMATVVAAAAAAERSRSLLLLPSPEIMPGQPWSSWVDASAKLLHGSDGADSEESFKDLGKNREAMRLCREDMPIFGQCPAQDDFYLVMCNHCSQVVKPQAFQAHYERRHSLASKQSPIVGRSSTVGPSVSNSKLSKPAKRKPFLPFRVEKIHLKVDPSVKLPQAPSAMTTASTTTTNTTFSSSSGTTVSSNTATVTSIPKPPQLAPGQIPNGKGHASVLLEKKPDSSGASSRRHLYKRLSDREFNPDIHCGVVDMTARKPCTRSLTCKTHSLSQRRAVSGRRKRFDMLLAEHKSRPRDRERELHPPHSQQTPPLREPHPSSRLAASAAATHDPHPTAHGNGTAATTAAAEVTTTTTTKSPAKPRSYNSGVPRKIPLALENSSSSSVAPAHRTSTNPHSSTSSSSSGFLSPSGTHPPYGQSYEGRSPLSYGTTLNARASPQGGAEHPAYGTTQARQVSSLPQMPSAHSSSPLRRAFKSRSSGGGASKAASFRPRDNSSGSSTPVTPSSLGGGGGGGANSTSSNASFSSGKKRKNSSFLAPSHGPSSDSSNANYSSSSSSFKKNCANAQGSSGSTYHHGSLAPAASSSSSSSHSGVHSMGLNCGPTVRTNSLSLKAEPSGGAAGGSSSGPSPRGPPSGSPAESIKRMSVVMNSSDSTLSLGPFVHHHHQSPSEHHAGFGHHASDGRLDGKKRKSSPASSGGGGPGIPGGGGGVGGPGRPKVAKSPSINNIHGKHGRSVTGTPGLPNNSHLHQPKARP
ncbi:hypothetical protein CRUP_017041 [Coryphaenoides rupestris]|nr:hypothetical protein CRUP_017041 [Coryphaenoides rupestris]